MSQYTSFSVSVQGYSHIVKGIVCQDSSGHLDDGGLHIAVTADGHGDRACFRSDVGSALAVELALEQLREFAAALGENGVEQLFEEKKRNLLLHQLSFSLIGTWRERVEEHYQANPPEEEALAASGKYEDYYRAGQFTEHIYGTTLIACLLTPEYLLVMHQGDGRCVVIRQSGVIEQPVPWDPRCEGRETTSLCSSDAVDACRFYVSDQQADPIVAVYALSDGVEDSYETQEEVNAFCGKLTARCVEHGVETVAAQLLEELPEFSRLGSRDDVSVSAILDPEAAAAHVETFRIRSGKLENEAKMRHAKERMDSMFMKRRHLQQELDDAQARLDSLREEVDHFGEMFSKIREKLKLLRTQEQDKKDEVRDAELALEAARKAFEEYEAEYSQVEAEWREADGERRTAEAQLDSLGLSGTPEDPEPTGAE